MAASPSEAELHVVGCVPPRRHPRMVIHGFLRKDVPEEAERLIRLYRQSHLFVFPTRGDLSPGVLAEAAATSLPAITTRVGGIPEMFEGDEIVLLDPSRFREEAVATIPGLLREGHLDSLGRRARRRFETHLNLDMIASRIVTELRGVVQ